MIERTIAKNVNAAKIAVLISPSQVMLANKNTVGVQMQGAREVFGEGVE
ncbi:MULTISPECIES: hypothetical protein [unclassified Mesorhizobium]|nr:MULTISPECIES: hypothetical protein [unclassified Mesorhizobium]